MGKCAHLTCIKQTPSKREAYLAAKRATIDHIANDMSLLMTNVEDSSATTSGGR
jgi:hypothetical protein